MTSPSSGVPIMPAAPQLPAQTFEVAQAPPILVTDGPCPPGMRRIAVDALDASGRFTAGFSYCAPDVQEPSGAERARRR
ncbi:hypothetical protein [Methylobacterium crusticola]|uniref:hypothetical protein n=1 Tax=Methylobacterium crusticola TaxID=1697972 RepID=UPI000FFCBB2B|nr:hypothetical protein [Methylobacterium crusticola]